MPRQRETREAALLMIGRRGTSAAVRAVDRALKLQADAQHEAAELWQSIASEITRIRNEEREVYAQSLEIFETSQIDRRAS